MHIDGAVILVDVVDHRLRACPSDVADPPILDVAPLAGVSDEITDLERVGAVTFRVDGNGEATVCLAPGTAVIIDGCDPPARDSVDAAFG